MKSPQEHKMPVLGFINAGGAGGQDELWSRARGGNFSSTFAFITIVGASSVRSEGHHA